ncbi:MAG: hypothetical protein ABW170_21280 [Candidatus Thiodiazotropha sp. L084R]
MPYIAPYRSQLRPYNHAYAYRGLTAFATLSMAVSDGRAVVSKFSIYDFLIPARCICFVFMSYRMIGYCTAIYSNRVRSALLWKLLYPQAGQVFNTGVDQLTVTVISK